MVNDTVQTVNTWYLGLLATTRNWKIHGYHMIYGYETCCYHVIAISTFS